MTRLSLFCLAIAFACFGIAAGIPPARLVDSYLPAAYASYRETLLQGLWLFKCSLGILGLATLTIPFAARWFPGKCSTTFTNPIERLDIVLVVIATVLGAALRVYQLDSGFGYDEIYVSSSLMERDLPGLLARAEPHRVLYAVLGHFVYLIAGPSEVAARIPAMCFGVASIPAIYVLISRWIGRREAVASSFLLAISTFHIWYSQEATSYTLALFYAILSGACFHRCLKTDHSRPWLIWIGTTYLALVSHFFIGGILLCSQIVYLFLTSRSGVQSGSRVRCAIAVLFICLGFITTVAVTTPLYLQMLGTAADTEIRGPLLDNLVFLGQWLSQTYAHWMLQVVLIAGIGIGAMLLVRRNYEGAKYLLMPLCIVLALFVTGVMHFITPRYTILGLIPAVTCLAASLVALHTVLTETIVKRSIRIRSTSLWLLLAVPIGYAALSSLSVYFERDRHPFRAVARQIISARESDETVYFGGYGFDKFQHYTPFLVSVDDCAQLRHALADRRGFWLVYYLPSYWNDLCADVRDGLSTRTVEHFEYEGLPDQLVTPHQGFVLYVSPRERDSTVVIAQ